METTPEFQSVLRACEEHLDDFRFSFLPYGLLIKFANEGGDNNDDKPDEETKDEANDDDKPDEETKEEAKDLTPHLSSMTCIDVFVSDVGGENRQKYVVDLKDGDGMDFYLKVVKDFDYPDSAVLYKEDNGLEISACWMLRVYAGLLNDGDELVINCKYSSGGMVRFPIDTYDGTFGYTLWASKQDTIRDIYERALKLPNVVLSKLSPAFSAEADDNQDAKKCSGEFDCQDVMDKEETDKKAQLGIDESDGKAILERVVCEDVELNEKSSKTKGTVIVYASKKGYTAKWSYHYTGQCKILQVQHAITNKIGIQMGPDSCFRLNYPNGKSIFEAWEPVEASLGADKSIILTVSLSGGGKAVKKQVIDKKKFAEHLKTSNAENTERLQKAKHM